jgi:rhamnosyltransferase
MLTCLFDDRNAIKQPKVSSTEFEEVDECITSGALTKCDAYRNIDGFDVKMFIDLVDFDLNIQFRNKHLKIYRLNQKGFLHEIGDGHKEKILGREVVVSNHSQIRRYYFSRNSVYLIKKYGWGYSSSKYLINNLKSMIKVVLFEKNKVEKTIAALRGMFDGVKMTIMR